MEWFWFFPLFCLIFMVGMMLMMFRHGGCMSMFSGPRGGHGGEPETAHQVLERRYAGGQIGKDEYETLKRTLQTSGRTT